MFFDRQGKQTGLLFPVLGLFQQTAVGQVFFDISGPVVDGSCRTFRNRTASCLMCDPRWYRDSCTERPAPAGTGAHGQSVQTPMLALNDILFSLPSKQMGTIFRAERIQNFFNSECTQFNRDGTDLSMSTRVTRGPNSLQVPIVSPIPLKRN